MYAGSTLGQCTSSIPANAVVITSTTAGVNGQSGTNFWLCDGAFQQIFTGSNNTFWVESSAFFNSINGNNNTINYKGSLPFGVYGSNNTIYATSASAISDQGSGNTINACGANSVVFNYSNAPTGCAAVGIEEAEKVPVTAQYDAQNDILVIDDPTHQLRELHLLDPAGRQMDLNHMIQTKTVPLTKFPSGLYIVRLVTEGSMRSYRFVK